MAMSVVHLFSNRSVVGDDYDIKRLQARTFPRFLAINLLQNTSLAEFWYVGFFLLENITLKQHCKKWVFPVASFEDLLLNEKQRNIITLLNSNLSCLLSQRKIAYRAEIWEQIFYIGYCDVEHNMWIIPASKEIPSNTNKLWHRPLSTSIRVPSMPAWAS